MVKLQPSKLLSRVRFSSPALNFVLCTKFLTWASLAQVVRAHADKREVGGSSPLVPINWRITQEAEEDGLLNR